eukprot:GGOE01047016.1.p1 GENE.GGOE01047016.1~~GGOE01047016.1.p1  ORF type:complete len:120 (-),score=6.68 GGOE01047016.1:341-700(-)
MLALIDAHPRIVRQNHFILPLLSNATWQAVNSPLSPPGVEASPLCTLSPRRHVASLGRCGMHCADITLPAAIPLSRASLHASPPSQPPLQHSQEPKLFAPERCNLNSYCAQQWLWLPYR